MAAHHQVAKTEIGLDVKVNFALMMVRPQSDLAKARIADALRDAVWPLLEVGRVAPVIDSAFDLAEAPAAHERLESAGHIGKIVLKVAGG